MPSSSQKRPSLLLFDVNETLLNMSDMQQAVNLAFANELAFKLWFSYLLQYAQVENVTGTYNSFSKVGLAAMQMVTQITDKDISTEKQKELVEMVKATQPHPDVIPALKKLKENGFRLATLTNSPATSSFPHLENLGLSEYFEIMLSVDSIKKFKPHPSSYHYAADKLHVKLEDMMLVAAHGWDIAGATRAGARAAFISRPGQVIYPLAPEPEITAPDFDKLTDKLLKMSK